MKSILSLLRKKKWLKSKQMLSTERGWYKKEIAKKCYPIYESFDPIGMAKLSYDFNMPGLN